MARNLIYSQEFMDFKNSGSERLGSKLDYLLNYLQQAPILSQKFVKKLVSSEFYELRVSVDNEVRIILFSLDNLNISLATKVVILNGFVKKDNKDYKRQIEKAETILKRMLS